MPLACRLLLVMAMMLSAFPARAQAPAIEAAATYVVAYFESAPAAANAVAAGLRQFAAATRKEAGNQGFVALREAGRPGRFALVEAWRDKAALDAHGKAMDELRDRLRPQLTAPFDIRPCVPLDVAAPVGGATARVYVLTHVDVIPTFKDQTIGLVKELSADSRKEPGVVRFDVLQQGNRANHMFLVEAWRDRAALDAHAVAEPTREFRAKLLPFEGALYDERIYEPIR